MPIDPRWNEITCLIGQIKGGIKKNEYTIPSDLIIKGTGVFLSYKKTPIIVTARHVIEGRKNLLACFGPRNSKPALVIDIDESQKRYNTKWHYFSDKRVDLAISIIDNPEKPNLFGFSMFIPFSETQQGNSVIFLGYPLGLIPYDNLAPFHKRAIISRKISELTDTKGEIQLLPRTFLLDGYIDEGNSGSPVIQEPGFLAYYLDNGQLKIPPAREGLIGIATGHFSTKQSHAGLGICISIDYIMNILESDEMKKEFDVHRKNRINRCF